MVEETVHVNSVTRVSHPSVTLGYPSCQRWVYAVIGMFCGVQAVITCEAASDGEGEWGR